MLASKDILLTDNLYPNKILVIQFFDITQLTSYGLVVIYLLLWPWRSGKDEHDQRDRLLSHGFDPIPGVGAVQM